MRVLIVEDDINLANALARILEDNGYAVDQAHDGQEGFDLAAAGLYDVIVLDVMLPRYNGFTVAQRLRRENVNTPILLLTARDSVSDKIRGLDSGADDYMTKPFSPAELMAHLRALTRRQGEVVFETLRAGDLTLRLDGMDLECNGELMHLSQKEFALARLLMANPGVALSKDALIDGAWGHDAVTSDNNVEAYISFLRKKLAHLGSSSKIETLRGVGYRLLPSAPGTAPAES